MRRLTACLLALGMVLLLHPLSIQAGGVPWGEPINTPGERFIVLSSYNGEAVYDKETGLVWEQTPGIGTTDWFDALFDCNNKTVGNRKGWRLPTIQELQSLVDPTVLPPGPTLPPGHPFGDPLAPIARLRVERWSASTHTENTNNAYSVNFSGSFGTGGKTNAHAFWCVRGGQGVDPQ